MSGSPQPQTPATPLVESPERTNTRRVIAWGLWDWGSASFNAVVTTFVFTVYLTTADGFGGETFVSQWLAWTLSAAGLVIAVLAPVTGQRSDTSGRRKFWLGVNTALVVLATALLFFVAPEASLLPLGLLLLGAGNIFFEFAGVNYNAMLSQVATPRTIGRVSGFGWGMGYLGGIVLLLVVYFGFISPDVGLFGVTGDEGMDVRVSMLVSAVWFGLFALPVFFAVPEYSGRGARRPRVGIVASYRRLGASIARLWRTDRPLLGFLAASAVFRDGLAGVFTFGGVLAAGSFGFSPGEVIIFAIVANVVAGISTITVGLLDDRLGARPVIITALIGLVVAGVAIFVFHDGGQGVFWLFGLILCLFVGPAQSASRSYLARIIPAGEEGEIFGLYATTGRAVSFLAPLAFGIFITIGGAQYWGILGIVSVLAIGLVLLLLVRPARTPADGATAPRR
ncbi:UMF1 family MFS transporter [Labedella gwakjiensis]|uniref:MFS transporter n=1 Tax=Labedella gwakjiensis TaxID=390269 RepID=A0A2P8GWT3_9MICO|nr:MFS transporter [Labedella gwakjiensis]PSL38426.1 UMF1 family MFS transporter [Labedella gwakjiensis]RUQ87049.1 MFS transporter [Labedella gwakjiensis]